MIVITEVEDNHYFVGDGDKYNKYRTTVPIWDFEPMLKKAVEEFTE